MRAEHTHCVQHAAARRQQHGDMVSGCQLVIHNNTENPQTSLSLDVGARWRRRRTVATRREDQTCKTKTKTKTETDFFLVCNRLVLRPQTTSLFLTTER